MQKEKQNQTHKAKSPKQALEESDIIEILKEDHKPIKRLIKIMKNLETDFSERKEAFEEFAPTLIAHAKPEEEILYTAMKREAKLRELGFEGDVEHALADQLVEECNRTVEEDLLSARMKVLAELVEHHIEEEEQTLLPKFKKHIDQDHRETLGKKFLTRKLDYLAKGENVIPDPKTESMKH